SPCLDKVGASARPAASVSELRTDDAGRSYELSHTFHGWRTGHWFFRLRPPRGGPSASRASLDSPFVRLKINFSMVGWRGGFFGGFWLLGVLTGWKLGRA